MAQVITTLMFPTLVAAQLANLSMLRNKDRERDDPDE